MSRQSQTFVCSLITSSKPVPLWSAIDDASMMANTTLSLVMFSLSIKKSWQETMEITFPSRLAIEDKRRFLYLESSRVIFRFVYQESKQY